MSNHNVVNKGMPSCRRITKGVKTLLVWALALLVVQFISAQNENYSHNSSWNALTIEADINDKWSVKNELNFRRTNFLKNWEQLVLRPSVQYSIDNRLTAAIGYTYIQNYSYSNFSPPLDLKEHNLWQQLFIGQNFEHFNLFHRLRFEERFNQNANLNNDRPMISGTDYSGRLRYRLIVALPLIKKQRISALLYDEVFLDFEEELRPRKFDQNWIFLGLRFRKSEHVTITSGYHHIKIPRDTNSIENHIWETSIVLSL